MPDHAATCPSPRSGGVDHPACQAERGFLVSQPVATVPRAGMLATVRNRSGVVAAVKPFDGEKGRLHLVHVEYKDSRSPVEERLLWELEPGCTLCRRRRRTTWLG